MESLNKKRLAVYAGSFDPPTNGHLWMIEEGAKLFDELIIAVGENPDKKSTFSLDERLGMLRAITVNFKNTRVDSFSHEYLVRYAARVGASHILRGIRSTHDFVYEQSIRHMNSDMDAHITTVFLTPHRMLGEVSSSAVKALIGPDGWQEVIKGMVPQGVSKALIERFSK